MSNPRYTCTESALMISPPSWWARAIEAAVFPTAVGPVIMITFGLLEVPVLAQGVPVLAATFASNCTQ